MNFFDDPCNVVTFTSMLLALVLDANDSLALPEAADLDNEEDVAAAMHVECVDTPVLDTFSFISSTLYNYRLCCVPYPLTNELGFWVKPRSTTWFSRFLWSNMMMQGGFPCSG